MSHAVDTRNLSNEALAAGEQKHNNEWRDGTPTGENNAIALAATYVPGTEEERKLLRKIDFRIVVSIARTCMRHKNAGRRDANGHSRVSGSCTRCHTSTEPTSVMPRLAVSSATST